MNFANPYDDEDCNSCDNLKQLSAMTGGAGKVFSNLQRSKPTENVVQENNENNPKKTSTDEEEDTYEMKRPINFEELGNSTWNLLHTMAAYYPETPTDERQNATKQFIHSLGDVYPCNECARDWKDEIKEKPPRVDSRNEFSQWACEIHNVVNEKLGKAIFPCSKVDERWRFDPKEEDKLYE